MQSTGVSQSVRTTSRDESQSVPSPEKFFKTRDLELPFFEGSLPSCSPHSVGSTRTFLHPYFPLANSCGSINSENCAGSFSENSGFRIAHVVRRHSEHGISHSENYSLNSETCSENTPERSQSSENGLFTLQERFS